MKKKSLDIKVVILNIILMKNSHENLLSYKNLFPFIFFFLFLFMNKISFHCRAETPFSKICESCKQDIKNNYGILKIVGVPRNSHTFFYFIHQNSIVYIYFKNVVGLYGNSIEKKEKFIKNKNKFLFKPNIPQKSGYDYPIDLIKEMWKIYRRPYLVIKGIIKYQNYGKQDLY